MAKNKVAICTGKACKKRGSKELLCAFEQSIESLGLQDDIKLKTTDCMGQCGRGPLIKVKKPEKTFYGWVSVNDVRELMWALVSNRPIERLRLKKKAG